MRIRVAPKGWVERVDQRARLSGISSPIWCSVAMISSPLDLLLKKRLPRRQPCRGREALRSRPRGDRAAGHRDSRGEYGCAASPPLPFGAEREAAIEPGESPLRNWLSDGVPV